jgi:hypothetical protein
VRVIVVVALVLSSFAAPHQQPCADLASCRSMAEDAKRAGDYEAFHDLAWATYRKGKATDVELMLLVARAQSRSGRPGDALVMLERIAALGGRTDAATSDDFARVRALPRWPEVADKLSSSAEPAVVPSDPAPVKEEPEKPVVEKPAPKRGEPSAPKVTPPAPKDPEPVKKSVAPPSASTKAPDVATPAADAPPKDAVPKAALSFTTVLTPGALAYDAVSKRFIIADGRARRVAVVDENTGQVATLVGEQGALGEVRGIAIDPQQGDLWVASSSDEGASLHRIQLISGRMLRTVPLAVSEPIVAMAHVRGAGLVMSDTTGVVWRVRQDGKVGKLATLEYVPINLAADTHGRLYVAGGASRIARFSVGATLRKLDTVELDDEIPPRAPFAVSGNRIHFVVPEGGGYTIRSLPIR